MKYFHPKTDSHQIQVAFSTKLDCYEKSDAWIISLNLTSRHKPLQSSGRSTAS